MRGLYIHIPFCVTKCAYCDFYSINYNRNIVSEYVEEICKRLNKIDYVFNTVYFGGGTPSVIGADNLSKILSHIKYKNDAEITVEVNPKSYKSDFFETLYKNGFNRISIGMQSAVDSELETLTRNHKFNDVKNTIIQARDAGFNNISIDVMLGTSGQTIESLKYTLEKCVELNPEHLSCYMLKIEEGTPYSKMSLSLPDEDIVSDMYLYMCDYLNKNGYSQYEISNFSKPDKQSRHNLLYWNCEEYLGIGPGAHSFIDGKRYYYPNDINYFLNGTEMIFSEAGGDLYDYIMLGLRLKDGININKINNNTAFINKFKKYCNLGYAKMNGERLFLTEKGFLVQNTILCDLLEEIQ